MSYINFNIFMKLKFVFINIHKLQIAKNKPTTEVIPKFKNSSDPEEDFFLMIYG